MVTFYPIRTERLVLRKAERRDADALVKLLNEPSISRNIPRFAYPYRRKHALDWIRRVRKVRHHETFGEGRDWVIEWEGKVVGACHLSWNRKEKRGFVGYWVGKPYRGKGIATEATQALLDLTFGRLGAEKVWAMTFSDNVGSRRVLEKAGMREEALLRRNAFHHGRWRDDACYGALRREWLRARHR